MEEGIYTDSVTEFIPNNSPSVSNETVGHEVYCSNVGPKQDDSSAVRLPDMVECGVYGEKRDKGRRWMAKKPKPKSVSVVNPIYDRTLEIQTNSPSIDNVLPTVTVASDDIDVYSYASPDAYDQISLATSEVKEVDVIGSSENLISPQSNEVSAYEGSNDLYTYPNDDCTYLQPIISINSKSRKLGVVDTSIVTSKSYTDCGEAEDDADHVYETFDEPPLDSADESFVSSNVPPQPPPVDSIAEVKQKRSNKRYHVIKEIVNTEEDYLQDITVTIDDIMKPLTNHKPHLDVNVDTLFGNIEDIRRFSAQLCSDLKEAHLESAMGSINIGEIFISHIPRMKEVYKIYCRNHDDTTMLLEKYEEEADFKTVVQSCLDDVKNKVNTFDLGSFLIKPVQRILKYPLLLQELLKLTDIPQSDAPSSSYNDLLQAVKLMQEVANDINEDKRRKDLVRKYRNPGQEGTISGKISKLSLHSVKKKGARISLRISHVTGFNQPDTVDENFNMIEQKFKDLERAVKNFLQNSSNYLDRCRDFLNVEYVVSDHLNEIAASDRSSVLASYGMSMRRISEQLYRQFHDRTKLRVHSPLLAMLERFKAPQSLIGKRSDKLLDFESCQKTSDSKEKTQMARNVYEALNQQLLDELPKLCELGYKLIQTCVRIFVSLQMQFHNNIRKELSPVLEKCPGDHLHDDGYKARIMEQFNSSHNQALYTMRHFTVIPASFCAFLSTSQSQTRTSESSRNRSQSIVANQTPSQREELMNKYKNEDLFIAVANNSSVDKIDVSCSINDVIAVIKRQNPLGSTDTWFCDNGAAKGFLPSNILRPINTIMQSPTLQRNLLSPGSPASIRTTPTSPNTPPPLYVTQTSPSSSPYSIRQGLHGNVGSLPLEELSVDTEESLLKDVFQEEDEMLDDTEYGECENTSKDHFRVEFSFHASTDLELSAEEGDILILIVPHDLEGNSEWWLMADSHGNQGYVPATYMSRAEYL